MTALSVLKSISATLTKRADLEGSAERRKAITDSCLDIMTPQASFSLDSKTVSSSASFSQLCQDFINNHAKKITDSRRKVVEGVAKGMVRICTVYSV